MPFSIAIQRTEHPVLELTTSKLFCNRLLTNRANALLQTLAQIIFFIFRHRVSHKKRDQGDRFICELYAFWSCVVRFDACAWDRQIEADQRAGKLGQLAAEARIEYEAGKARRL